jgi:hypothetical protein
MTQKHGPLGFQVDDRYRNLPEARIVEMLILVGWAYEPESHLAEETTREALQTWAQNGLGFRRAPNGERFFDPIEVFNFMKRSGFEGRDVFLSERLVPTSRRLVVDLANSGPPGVGPEGERRFTVDLKRTFNLQAFPSGKKLRLRMPLPIIGDYIKDLQVTPFTEAGEEAETSVSPGRLELRMTTSGEPEAILGAKLSFTARSYHPRAERQQEKPEALYLNEKEGLIVVTERIRALARSVAGTAAPALEAVRAFWEYINRELMSGYLHYDQIDLASPCDWVLDSGWFDCQLGGALFIALCRACGIPSRLRTGYSLFHKSPTRHYWAEAWLEDRGWTPFDFMSWDLSPGGLDTVWRDHFFGRLDYRMAIECMPREFTGALGVPLPPAWCVVQVSVPGGVEINFLDVSGSPVYADIVCVAG